MRREANRLPGSANQCGGFVDALLILSVRVGIGYDADPGLHVHDVVFDERGDFISIIEQMKLKVY